MTNTTHLITPDHPERIEELFKVETLDQIIYKKWRPAIMGRASWLYCEITGQNRPDVVRYFRSNLIREITAFWYDRAGKPAQDVPDTYPYTAMPDPSYEIFHQSHRDQMRGMEDCELLKFAGYDHDRDYPALIEPYKSSNTRFRLG